jgi:hypothetical protein
MEALRVIRQVPIKTRLKLQELILIPAENPDFYPQRTGAKPKTDCRAMIADLWVLVADFWLLISALDL